MCLQFGDKFFFFLSPKDIIVIFVYNLTIYVTEEAKIEKIHTSTHYMRMNSWSWSTQFVSYAKETNVYLHKKVMLYVWSQPLTQCKYHHKTHGLWPDLVAHWATGLMGSLAQSCLGPWVALWAMAWVDSLALGYHMGWPISLARPLGDIVV